MRAINEEPLGTNSKFFAQFSRPGAERRARHGRRLVRQCRPGRGDRTIYQASRRDPGRSPGSRVGSDWGTTYGLTNYFGQPPASMVTAYLAGTEGCSRASPPPTTVSPITCGRRRSPRPLGTSPIWWAEYTGFQQDPGSTPRTSTSAASTSIAPGYVEGGLAGSTNYCNEVVARLSRSRFQLGTTRFSLACLTVTQGVHPALRVI